MPAANLTNLTIKKLEDKNFNPYYLIVNQDNSDEVYFCFSGAVKEGWQELVNNCETIKEVEIEYIENERGNKKVISLHISQEGEVFI